MSFQSLNLIPEILQALSHKGYETPTPIQAKAIPVLLEGKDLLGIAQTGTGKTAAFTLPILNALTLNHKKVSPKSCRALILTPTRELAAQINENIESYSTKLKTKTSVIFGGVKQGRQVESMARGVDILIATPGRLLDLINQNHVDLSEVEVLVLDEADKMLDMGFINDIKKIQKYLPTKRQTLLFSATMPKSIAGLAENLLSNPTRVEVTPQAKTADLIDQKIMFVLQRDKIELLNDILKQDNVFSAIVFMRTKYNADRVVTRLENAGISARAIHSNKSQNAREKALESFKNNETNVLVATDIAARGIDVPDVGHIINFDLPEDPESYVHRIGRTARAGKSGMAISFCNETEVKTLKSIEKLIKMEIQVDNEHPFYKKFKEVESIYNVVAKEEMKRQNSQRSKQSVRKKGKKGKLRF